MDAYSPALLTLLAALAVSPQADRATPIPAQLALACYYTGDEISGPNKLCFYDCAGSRAAITVRITQLCPLSINR